MRKHVGVVKNHTDVFVTCAICLLLEMNSTFLFKFSYHNFVIISRVFHAGYMPRSNSFYLI